MMIVDDEYLAAVRARPESGQGMSNYDHSIDEGLEADLRAGMRAHHAAWDFSGTVWFDAETGRFCEAVMVYRELAGAVTAATLPDLMREVNAIYGAA